MASSSENPQSSPGSDASPFDDRISNLTESIICYILSFSHTNKAVATSTLSKSWQFLWTKANTFWLDNNGNDFEDFEETVDKVLMIQLEFEKLDNFHLYWSKDDYIDPANLSKWISEAIARNVKVIGIIDESPHYDDELIQLPVSLFTSKTLKSLSLQGPFLVEVPGTIYLPKLRDLQLNYVLYCWARFPSNWANKKETKPSLIRLWFWS
ncbi:OLC1v1012917C1 [Oldenlandia corymbosa var. corymbosa]|uniref:OLC1v1012917C1 n=1 Tax=Oldenlandia corymbosa var. corymbosa TaxID=529605 RepID=A0AAV1DX02_OLDCO|nr:OLC1v1012917C1 [Oldenlandia corymbosa var. corymbosa]